MVGLVLIAFFLLVAGITYYRNKKKKTESESLFQMINKWAPVFLALLPLIAYNIYLDYYSYGYTQLSDSAKFMIIVALIIVSTYFFALFADSEKKKSDSLAFLFLFIVGILGVLYLSIDFHKLLRLH